MLNALECIILINNCISHYFLKYVTLEYIFIYLFIIYYRFFSAIHTVFTFLIEVSLKENFAALTANSSVLPAC